MKVRGLLFFTLLAGSAGLVQGALALAEPEPANSGPPVLRHDPFAKPARPEARGTAGNQPADRSAEPGEAPEIELRAVLLAGANSMANIGGTIVGIGDQVGGYTLVAVRQQSALLQRDGSRLELVLRDTDHRSGSGTRSGRAAATEDGAGSGAPADTKIWRKVLESLLREENEGEDADAAP